MPCQYSPNSSLEYFRQRLVNEVMTSGYSSSNDFSCAMLSVSKLRNLLRKTGATSMLLQINLHASCDRTVSFFPGGGKEDINSELLLHCIDE